jgi:hypothetical protein
MGRGCEWGVGVKHDDVTRSGEEEKRYEKIEDGGK